MREDPEAKRKDQAADPKTKKKVLPFGKTII
jgi:hypothetical protein